MRRLPPLSALRAFEAAARHASFKRAADELAVTPTAVSHQVRALESHTGLRLFERKVRKVVLTDAGQQLYPVLRDGFDAFEATLARLLPVARRARVTISATNAFTAKWLIPRVARFNDQHPDIDLQLHASDEPVMLGGSGVDIAVRYGRGPYPGLAAERMLADDFAPVANPLLNIRSPADLARVPLIHFQWQTASPDNVTWDRWFALAGLTQATNRRELRFSDESHAIQAALAGQGVALVSRLLVADEVAAGRLVQPFGPSVPGHAYHLVTRADGKPGAHVRAAIDWLRSELG